MQVKSSVANGFTIVKVQGRIDSVTASDFESKFQSLIENEIPDMVFDCSQLEYVSSAGLRVFLIIYKKVVLKGHLVRLCCMQPSIREIFDISGFSNYFPIFPDVATAITG
jgi:anti-anti-sigma factor